MIINTNMASLNTIRQLSINEKATQGSLAKLSSGLRINSAADDAAGLAISEKMRGQISGLNTASQNAQNGINLVSTAEGALNETTSILQRMRELAVQAGNDTNTTSDRQAMQTETNQLISAIDDIGNQTQFNTKNLLNGGAGVTANVTGAAASQISVLGGSADTKVGGSVVMTGFTTATAATATAVTGTAYASANANLGAASSIVVNGVNFSFTTSNTAQDVVNTINNASIGATATYNTTTNKIDLASNQVGSAAKLTIGAETGDFTSATVTAGADATATITSGQSYTASGNNITISKAGDSANGLSFKVSGATGAATLTVSANGGLTMQIGANQGQTMYIGINDMRAAALGVNAIDLTTQAGAASAITSIDNATAAVSSERSNLGAFQNRLEHTINNLGTASQNITSAEANIRDVNMAAEMTNFQKNNILQQAAQAMLAQANQQPQGVLQLLR